MAENIRKASHSSNGASEDSDDDVDEMFDL